MNKTALALFAFVLLATSGIVSVQATEARELGKFRTDVRNSIRTSVEHSKVTHNFGRRERRGIDRSVRTSINLPSQHTEPNNNTESEASIPDETASAADNTSDMAEEVTTKPEMVIKPVVTDNAPEDTEPEVTTDPPTLNDTTEEVDPVTPDPVVEAPEVDGPEDVTSTEPATYLEQVVYQVHRLTNTERVAAGLTPLKYDNALAQVAESHSEDMAANNYFSHIAPDGCTLTCRLAESNYSASSWGENIAWISKTNLPDATELAQEFVDRWMDSKGHRENILRTNFTHEGIGVAKVGNRVYATANFSRPS